MRSLVVFLAVAAVAHGSLLPLAQPPHHPALVLDPHGRPLDTAEVIASRALHLQAKALEGHYTPLALAPAHYAAPAAVSHQARIDVHSSPALVATYAAAPYLAHGAYGIVGHSHYLKKRSLALAHAAYAAPAAVSHQSRVDVHSSPALVSHAVAAPAYHAVHAAPAAVSHQSRVDVHSSPALVSHAVAVAPVYHAAPAAVSHQSRVDVRSSPALYAHQYAAPLAHHYAAAAPLAYSSPLVHGW